MRWDTQAVEVEEDDVLPGLGGKGRVAGLVRTVETPEFAGMRFHEVLARTALNHVPGTSKRMPLAWTINPYRGCSHACVYCVSPDTLVLMGDGRQRPISSLEVGDEIYGTERRGAYRRYVKTTVQAKWSTRKRAFRVTLADGTELTASADHRFLTDRGWKHVRGTMSGGEQRPHLTLNNKLIGFGLNGLAALDRAQETDAEYRAGYLAGMIRGDGMIFKKDYPRRAGGGSRISMFRLALADAEALERTRHYLELAGVSTTTRPFAASGIRPMLAIHTARERDVAAIESVILTPEDPCRSWYAGFLGGIFDAEGSCSRGVLRISNSDAQVLADIRTALGAFGLPFVHEAPRENGVSTVRITGGLEARQRFFGIAAPAITRKLDIEGSATKSNADLRIVAIEDLGVEIDMVDITTGTGDFIANGVVAHNCFARPTHRYLDLDMGEGFDREIVVKVNTVEVLRRELAKPTWEREPVALGTNTDPYQRAEGRYRLMPGIIEALAESGTPFSILTKGTLLRRDLPLIREAAEHVPVSISMSIAVYDEGLAASVEPGAPSAKARLETVRAAADLGLPVSVFLMPILPYLTDTRDHLERAARAVRDAGGARAIYTALHLRPGVKEWFMQWLEREHPDLVPKYRAMYGRGAYAPKEYREWLGKKVRPILRAYGLDQDRTPKEHDATGQRRSFASSGSANARDARSRTAASERAAHRHEADVVAESAYPSVPVPLWE